MSKHESNTRIIENISINELLGGNQDLRVSQTASWLSCGIKHYSVFLIPQTSAKGITQTFLRIEQKSKGI